MANTYYNRNFNCETEHRTFKELLLWSCMTKEETAELCGCSKRTIQNWIENDNPNKSAERLIEWYFYGIPQDKEWKEWKIRKGNLISKEGEIFKPKHLKMLPIIYVWYREEMRKLEEIDKRVKLINKGSKELSLVPKE